MALDGSVEAVNGSAKGAAAGFVSLKQHLVVLAQKADEAVQFYKAAFAAEVVKRVSNRKRKAEQAAPFILCAELRIGSASLLLCGQNDDGAGSKVAGEGVVFRLETGDVEAAVSNTVKAGAVLDGELVEEGLYGGGLVRKLKDPFGHVWIIASVGKRCASDAQQERRHTERLIKQLKLRIKQLQKEKRKLMKQEDRDNGVKAELKVELENENVELKVELEGCKTKSEQSEMSECWEPAFFDSEDAKNIKSRYDANCPPYCMAHRQCREIWEEENPCYFATDQSERYQRCKKFTSYLETCPSIQHNMPPEEILELGAVKSINSEISEADKLICAELYAGKLWRRRRANEIKRCIEYLHHVNIHHEIKQKSMDVVIDRLNQKFGDMALCNIEHALEVYNAHVKMFLHQGKEVFDREISKNTRLTYEYCLKHENSWGLCSMVKTQSEVEDWF